mmetsp:Transcript_21207/g.39431  ORF Transcript_21207/g.39431 Transcript_21207/m.39431 type:complete len:367 (+) Transcript_21207:162-1262(+)
MASCDEFSEAPWPMEGVCGGGTCVAQVCICNEGFSTLGTKIDGLERCVINDSIIVVNHTVMLLNSIFQVSLIITVLYNKNTKDRKKSLRRLRNIMFLTAASLAAGINGFANPNAVLLMNDVASNWIYCVMCAISCNICEDMVNKRVKYFQSRRGGFSSIESPPPIPGTRQFLFIVNLTPAITISISPENTTALSFVMASCYTYVAIHLLFFSERAISPFLKEMVEAMANATNELRLRTRRLYFDTRRGLYQIRICAILWFLLSFTGFFFEYLRVIAGVLFVYALLFISLNYTVVLVIQARRALKGDKFLLTVSPNPRPSGCQGGEVTSTVTSTSSSFLAGSQKKKAAAYLEAKSEKVEETEVSSTV